MGALFALFAVISPALSLRIGIAPTAGSRHAPPCANSEMQWRRAQQERNNGAATGWVGSKPEAAPKRGNDVDDVDFFGAVGGGVITREALLESQRVSDPVSIAENALVETMDSIGSLAPAKARDTLSQQLESARAVGVDANSPQYRKAEALLGAMRVAAPGDSQKRDKHQSAMEAIHSDEYAFPDLDF